MSHFKKFEGDFINNEELYVVEDYRNTVSTCNEKDYPMVLEELKKAVAHFKIVTVAIVVDSPYETVLEILYEGISKQVDNYRFKTFSTVNAAKDWLNSFRATSKKTQIDIIILYLKFFSVTILTYRNCCLI